MKRIKQDVIQITRWIRWPNRQIKSREVRATTVRSDCSVKFLGVEVGSIQVEKLDLPAGQEVEFTA